VKRPGRSLAGLLLIGLALTACGKKGPPLPPEVRLPIPPAGLRASIDENAILVTWTNPGTRIDGSRLRDLTEVRVYRRGDTDDGPLKPAILSRGRIVGYEQIAAIRLDSPAPATVRGLNVEWVDRSGLVPGHRYVYVLTALDAQGRSSPPSERRPITFLAAPMPPLDVQATAGNRQVTINWRAPGEFTDATPATGEIRYIVLRSVGTEKSMEVITPQPIDATTYTQTGLQNDTEYHYAVRAVRVDPRATVTGPPSTAVAATPFETARPSAPHNLVGVPSADAVRLAWSGSPEPNVASYAVYRAIGSAAPNRIGTTPAGTTTFTDRDVRPGLTYRYTVTALDDARRPNESPPSNEVTLTLP
jgi:predicted small lipoprotein YifL